MAISSDLEILISRYAEGDDSLTPAERQRVEHALDTDADANDVLAGEHRLTNLLRAAPLPEVNYELLAARISANIPNTAAAVIEPRPATASRSFWTGSKLAMAASVLIAAGVAIPILNRGGDGRPGSPGTVVNSGPDTSMTAAAPVTIRAMHGGTGVAATPADAANVVIGPSPAVAGRPAGDRYTEASGNRPAKVVISGETPATAAENPLAPR